MTRLLTLALLLVPTLALADDHQHRWHEHEQGPGLGTIFGQGVGTGVGISLGQAVTGGILGWIFSPPAQAPSAPAQDPAAHNAYCMNKYRSFDIASGTYLGFDGLRHPCL